MTYTQFAAIAFSMAVAGTVLFLLGLMGFSLYKALTDDPKKDPPTWLAALVIVPAGLGAVTAPLGVAAGLIALILRAGFAP